MRRAVVGALMWVAAVSAASGQQPAGVSYRMVEGDSRVLVVVGRSGALGFLGHEHAILATRFDAALCADPADLAQASLRFLVPTASLVIDSEEARRAAGMGSGPSASAIREIQGKLLDRSRLAADSFPQLQFTTRSVRRTSADSLRVEGDLRIRDVSRAVSFPARVTTMEQAVQFDAKLRVKHSDYGIRPERVAGVVRVRDEVEIRVRLSAQPTAVRCTVGDRALQ